jgi:hypothetical protein
MKDHRLRIGMRFVQQGREFVIEGPLLDNQLKSLRVSRSSSTIRALMTVVEEDVAERGFRCAP